MRYFLDTEFHEDGRTIDLISIGVVAEDGRAFYACNLDADWPRINREPWLVANVVPHLPEDGDFRWMSRAKIRDGLLQFVGADPKPEFWAYYADYDWVALCQLFGRMIDLPKHFPMFCRDLKQLAVDKGNPTLPKQESGEHDALADARWDREVYAFLTAKQAAPMPSAADLPDEPVPSHVGASLDQAAWHFLTEDLTENDDAGNAKKLEAMLDAVWREGRDTERLAKRAAPVRRLTMAAPIAFDPEDADLLAHGHGQTKLSADSSAPCSECSGSGKIEEDDGLGDQPHITERPCPRCATPSSGETSDAYGLPNDLHAAKEEIHEWRSAIQALGLIGGPDALRKRAVEVLRHHDEHHAREGAAIGLLKRWRERGFPMGGAPLWDETVAFLDALPEEAGQFTRDPQVKP